MDTRIMGLETEYGVHTVHPTKRPLAPDEVARYMFKPVVDWGNSSNVFISNGSRLYLDVGSHPEYATAETTRLDELIASDVAGDAIMHRLVTQAQQAMANDGFDGQVFLYRNNADSLGNSYGSHENYMIERTTQYRRLAEALLPFMVTRQLISGSGVVIQDPSALPLVDQFPTRSEPHFAFSQRADYMYEAISSSSTRARPMINTRDEPHADSSKFRRLHVIVGDSNMSETTQLLRFGATDLLLRIIEAGKPLPNLQLAHPVRAIRSVSHDLTGNTPLELVGGRTMTALEIQEYYLTMAQDFLEKNGEHHGHIGQIMSLWGRTLEGIRSQNYSAIDTEIDWAIKYKFFNAYAQKNNLNWDAARLVQLDMSYHDIDPQRGLFNLLQARGAAARVLTDAQVEAAHENPPATTRALLRHRFIHSARALGMDYSMDWTHMKLNHHPMQPLYVRDAFETDISIVDELFAKVASADL